MLDVQCTTRRRTDPEDAAFADEAVLHFAFMDESGRQHMAGLDDPLLHLIEGDGRSRQRQLQVHLIEVPQAAHILQSHWLLRSYPTNGCEQVPDEPYDEPCPSRTLKTSSAVRYQHVL